MGGFDAFIYRRYQGDAHSLATWIAAPYVSCEIGAGYDSDILALEQLTSEAFAVCDPRPEIEARIRWTYLDDFLKHR